MRRHRPRRRSGAVLLEVMVALAVLGAVASTAAWQTQEWMRFVQRAHAEESELRRAHRLLTAVSLWPREDLDRRLGPTAQGGWRLRIDRVAATLYEVSLADSASGIVLLRTAIYRDLEEPLTAGSPETCAAGGASC